MASAVAMLPRGSGETFRSEDQECPSPQQAGHPWFARHHVNVSPPTWQLKAVGASRLEGRTDELLVMTDDRMLGVMRSRPRSLCV